jgi:hypothetical protein
MFKPFTIYTILCNGCGKDLCDETEYSGWNDKDFLKDAAQDECWHIDKENHYCPDCHSFGDNDELILKTK